VLSAIEARVLGCLIEKQVTTPDQYPLSMNALVLACNQTTNRDPVMTVTPMQVEDAIGALKNEKLARIVHPATGQRVTKYRQVGDETLELEPDERAVICLLLLRGPQTTGELRNRSDRLFGFESLAQVEAALARLAERPEPLVVLLERVAGHKEPRWATTMAEIVEPSASRAGEYLAAGPSRADRIAELEQRVATLEMTVARLVAELGVD
jgi:uncharacterized protein YceH (UPF0502 family)